MNNLQFLIDIQTRTNDAVAKVTQVQGALDRTKRSADALSHSTGGLKDAFMSIPGASFFTNPIVALSAGIGTVAKLGMEADRTQTSFNVLTGSAQKASGMIAEMNKYAAESPFDRMGIYNASQTMLGFGVSADKVIPSLKMLGDISMGNQERMKGLALVFGQVAANGRLQGQDLLQMISQGYNPLLDISKLTGKSMADLRDEMSKGNIPFHLVELAMQRATSKGGQFYQMNQKILETPYGRFGVMMDGMKDKMLQVYDVIKPMLIPAFNLAEKVMGLFFGVVQALFTILSPVVQGLMSFVSWILPIAPYILTAVAAITAMNWAAGIQITLLNGWRIAELLHFAALLLVEKGQKLLNLAMWSNPIALVIGAIVLLAAAAYACWKKFDWFRAGLMTAWNTVVGFANVIKTYVIARIRELLDAVGAVGSAIKELFSGNFEAAARQAGRAFQSFSGSQSKAQAARGAAAVWNNMGADYSRNLSKARAEMAAEKGADKAQKTNAASKLLPDGSYAGMIGGGTGKGGRKSGGGRGSRGGSVSSNDSETTGGSKPSTIIIRIGKLVENINVTMLDKSDTLELEQQVTAALTRVLATAGALPK